jgi:hypothetical protein
MAKYHQGRFRPKNPQKYRGDPRNIIYRSSWELKVCRKLDLHPDVIEWGSEELVIPYRSPIDGKMHRYFTDFIVKRKDQFGNIATIVLEVKPKKQTLPPDKSKGKTPTGRYKRSFLREVATFQINRRKWEAAEDFCRSRGWHFQILTEDDIGV